DVQGAVRPDGHAHGPVLRPGAVWMPEPVGKRLVGGLADRLAVLERDEDDAVARLRQRGPVPRSVEGDKGTAAIPRRELRPVVEGQPVGRPMPGKRRGRLLLLGAPPDLLAVAAILGG